MEENKENSESKFYSSMESVISKTVKLIENQVCEPDDDFLKSGIGNLDFHNSDFALLCGRSDSGKTAFALNILNNLAVKNKIPAAYISCGKTDLEEFGTRLISLNSKIPCIEIKKMAMEPEDFEKFKASCEKLSNCDLPLFFADLSNPSFSDISDSCFFLKEEQNVKFIVLDSLDYFQEILDSKEEDFRNTLKKLLEDFKTLTKNLKIPILVLAELPLFKARENNDNYYKDEFCHADFSPEEYFKKYMMIQRKADMIMFLKRENIYDSDKVANDKIERDFSLQIIKNNRGRKYIIPLEFYPPNMEFSVKN